MTGVLDPQKIEQVLDNNIIGRLGYRNGNKMYIIPVSYLYYGGKYIIVHSREGEKIDILRQYPDVCFEVDEIDNIDNYRGVLLWGEYEELTDSRERYYALDMLLRKILKQKLNEPANRGYSVDCNGRPGVARENKGDCIQDQDNRKNRKV